MGIGLAIARHFLDKGANVMFADMDEDRLEAEVGERSRAPKARSACSRATCARS